MNTMARKALVATALAGAVAFGASGVAVAAGVGAEVTGRGHASQEGVAYTIARDAARDQCPNRNDVALVDRSTWQENGGWSAEVKLRCN
ncbi:hypothetical protein SGFS_062340 [Streptomyces graminofaciens]|uniref:Secreted protein n=1 Tax=Streptomyces graminofaciens TaxID=68212 RepID=A0ABN5VQX0_9ACTN|nr:hypothetical protein [Streptomyces graminofaciens]BBC34940.1 hypothetical protein SGFS_062340 [Streptomyces graminofaciens]